MRPARLPIPPSRPGRSSVPAAWAAAGLAVLILATLLSGCSARAPSVGGPRIAFLFDGSSGDADEVTGPALAGLRFAALGTGRPETVQPVNVGLEIDESAEMLEEVADDRGVVAAVVAPWTSPPDGAVDLLADAGLPVVSLSWAWGPPAEGVWRSLAVDRTREAELLLEAGASTDARRSPCLAGDTHPTSAPLAETVSDLAGERGTIAPSVGVVDLGRPATAEAVAGRLATLGCDTVLWTGGAEALALLLDAAPGLRTAVATSLVKTEGGIAVGVTHALRRLIAVCSCADITLTTDPVLQRFVHDFQTESGGAPGPLAVEAYDAGRLLLELARRTPGGRTAVADALGGLRAIPGLLGTYRLDADGTLRSGPAPAVAWRASGSRWLPVAPLAAGDPTALPIGALLPIVRPGTRPARGRVVHRSRREL